MGAGASTHSAQAHASAGDYAAAVQDYSAAISEAQGSPADAPLDVRGGRAHAVLRPSSRPGVRNAAVPVAAAGRRALPGAREGARIPRGVRLRVV